MPRISPAEVKEVLGEEVCANLGPAILAAEAIVDGRLSGCGYSEAEKKVIEVWLAAHLGKLMDGGERTSKTVRGTSVSYNFTGGLGLDSTRYGQAVKLLDTCNVLQRIGLKTATLNVPALDNPNGRY